MPQSLLNMDWLNIHTSTIDSEPFVDATPAQRGTWLALMRYCCGQENGGIIPGAAQFTDRKWQQLAGVTLAEVQDECRLWQWSETGLVIEFYPHEKEAIVKQKRRAGSSGGKRRAQAHAQAHASSTRTVTATTTPEESASTEGKGREGNGMEEEGNARARAEEEPIIPTEPEFLGAFMADGIPEDYLRAKFTWFAGNNAWLDRNGRLKNWRILVRGWWASDRSSYKPSGPSEKNGATRSWSAAMSPAQERFVLDRELHDVRARLNSAHALDLPAPAGDAKREREILARLKAMGEEAA